MLLRLLLLFALLLPGFRRIVKRRLKSRFPWHFYVSSPRGGWPEATEGDRIVDTRVIDVPPETPKRDD